MAVVVPAFNEERLIARTLGAIPAYVDDVVVVDDASHDRTAARVGDIPDPRVRLVRHRKNRGVGAAIATGYREAFRAGADVAVVMAGDGQMDPRDLPALLRPVLSGEADYSKGDRLGWPGAATAMPPLRFVGNHVLSWLTRLSTGLPVRDSQCGYTVASRAAGRALADAGLWPGYGYPNDALSTLAARGMRVADVRVRPVYGEEQSGIGARHALVVIPWVLARGWLRREAAAARDPRSLTEPVTPG